MNQAFHVESFLLMGVVQCHVSDRRKELPVVVYKLQDELNGIQRVWCAPGFFREGKSCFSVVSGYLAWKLKSGKDVR